MLFDGTADNTPNDYIGVSDTLGILLQSDYPVYSTQSKRATFVLVNHSQVTLESGEFYYITYEDRQGVWRNLPIHTIFNCVAHIIGPGKISIYPVLCIRKYITTSREDTVSSIPLLYGHRKRRYSDGGIQADRQSKRIGRRTEGKEICRTLYSR